MSKPIVIKGKAWVIKDADGNSIDNIDTDMIFHNAHLAVTEISEMGQYTFGNLAGWEDFPEKAGRSDIVICGGNFGAGSSRQQAVDCFIALGIGGLIAESFGAIYKRNAINTAFPILECPGVMAAEVSTGDEIEINFETGEFKNLTSENQIDGMKPFPAVQMDIYKAGSLFKVTP